MEIFLDNIIFSLQKAGGISAYWYELLSKFSQSSEQITFLNYPGASDNVFWRMLDIDIKTKAQKKRILERYRYPHIRSSINSKVIFHSSYYRTAHAQKALNISTIHDFTYEKYFPFISRTIHHWQKINAIKKSNGIICISENTKRDLYHYFPYCKIPIRVIYNGVSKKYSPIHNKEMLSDDIKKLLNEFKKPFLLYVGDRSVYKNFSLAVEYMRFSKNSFALVLAGGKSLSDVECKMLSDFKYHHFKRVGVDLLNELYNKAYALLYPSSYEGFGMPVLEAMKSGCPVIVRKNSSLSEAGGDAALYLENGTVKEMDYYVKQLNNETFREKIREKGLKHSAKFSWEKCFNETFSFYRDIYELHSS